MAMGDVDILFHVVFQISREGGHSARWDCSNKIGAEAIKQSEENGELPQGTRAYFLADVLET